MSDKKEKGGKFFLGAALGAIAGAVAGIVMAPKSGEETRKDIKWRRNSQRYQRSWRQSH